MRHNKHKNKLGMDPAHRKALIRNLSISLIEHGKIKSTNSRCKALRGHIERLITIAKVDTIANRRLVFSRINNRAAVKKLFTDVAPKFKGRPGGYTRINKLADGRVGDNAKVSYISFVE